MCSVELYNKNLPINQGFNFLMVRCGQERWGLPEVWTRGYGYTIVISGVMKTVDSLTSIFKDSISDVTPFSLFEKVKDLKEVQKEVEGLKKEEFPYELKRRATLWKGDWVELVFQPTVYVFKVEVDKAFASVLEKEKLHLIRQPFGARNTLQKEMLEALFESEKLQEHCTKREVDLMRRFVSEIKLISYEELHTDLTALTLKLKEKLQERPYTLLFQEGKSSQWIAELALPILGRVFTHDTSVKDFVFFDDFAYTGDQIRQGVFDSSTIPQDATLHVVVPYISEIAKERWARYWAMDRIQILHSGKTFHTIHSMKVDMVLFYEAYSKFSTFAEKEFNLSLPVSIAVGKNLAMGEWKFPDSVSIQHPLFDSFSKEHGDPVYKLPLFFDSRTNN